MESLVRNLGRERSLRENAQALHFDVHALSPGAVGAIQVTCADEVEVECIRAFKQGFVQFLLPSLKSGVQAPFTIANLGGRYEWGAVPVAESHYACAPIGSEGDLLVVKVNAHVGCEPLPATGPASPAGLPFELGVRRRYHHDTACCGMIAALLCGATGPPWDEVRELFASEGKDRLGAIQDDAVVPPALRPLVAAIVSARLQARVALLEIQDRAPTASTSYLVLAGVSVNRPGPDTEILCGFYHLDARKGTDAVVYHGLGDDPATYEVSIERDRLVVRDENLPRPRPARDHRALVRERWRDRHAPAWERSLDDPRLHEVRASVLAGHHRDAAAARRLLRAAVPILAEVAPVPTAVLAFAEGALGIHHVFRVHRLAREMEGSDEARRLLGEFRGHIDRLEPDRAEALLELLAASVRS